MKKSKLLMLSTIATFAGVAPIMTITSCGDKPSKDCKFECVQPQQDTEIGKSACWYTFNLTGGAEIQDDLEITTQVPADKLVTQPLWHTVSTTQLIVGIDGKAKNLTDGEEIPFKLHFVSIALHLDQQFDCVYVYHKPKVISTASRIEYFSPSQTIEKLFSFSLIDTDIQVSDLIVSVINADDKSEDLPDPSVLEVIDKGNNEFDVRVCLPGDGSTIGKAGDYANFDLLFQDESCSWNQLITNFSFQFQDVPYNPYTANNPTEVVIDYKGSKQPALKTMNGEHGVLTPSTKIGTPFEITFNLADWTKPRIGTQWKFGSYVNPEHSHVPYYHFSSITVSAMFEGSQEEKPLRQTEPGDYEGELGLWWVSEGGPITVLYDELIKQEEKEPTSIIFRLRTAETIEKESSFYITYA